MSSLLQTALECAKLGFYVFPLGDKSKKPRIEGEDWEEIATTDPAKIKEWWGKFPRANIGLAAGKSGLIVIDVDPHNGGNIDLLPLEDDEKKTVISLTGGDGEHYLYRQPKGVEFGNGNTMPKGIDSRGHGGYIVAPGSIHDETGKPYAWKPGASPKDLKPLSLPYALGKLLKTKEDEERPPVTTPPAIRSNGLHPYALAAMQNELQALATAPVSDRNNQLNRSAFSLGQLVAGGELSESEVATALEHTALAIGLTPRETAKTLKSGLEDGKKIPRQVPPSNGNGVHPMPEDDPEPEPTPQLRLTDLGNARRLVNLFGENIRYVNEWGRWYVWDGTRWALDKTGAIDRLAKKVPLVIYQEALQASDEMRPKIIKWGATSESAGKISAMIELARTEAGVAIEHEQLDAQPYLLNCKNGTIDLTAGKLLPHARADLITKRLEIDYNPDATCPLWLSFLDRVMGGNQEMISFLQRAVGYTLTGDVSEQCLFFKHGAGKNGKTVFSETLKALLGDYGQKAPTDMLMVKYGSSIPNDVARLPGARFVLAAEIEEGRRLAESQVKDLTGGDTIVARFMREEFFEFLPTHKLWLYGNHKPEIRGTDDGIWRRIRLIPFTVTIPQEERDPQLVKKLRAELPGILAWAVQGCLKWQDKGLQVPEAVEKATDSYRAEMDVISEFLGDRCVLYAHAKIKAGELYDVYCKWCEDNSERALSRRAFGQRLRERGFTSDKLSTHVFWFGIGLTTGLEVGNQERETTEI